MVLGGLVARERTGRGQKIVGSQFESSLQLGMVRSFEALNLPSLPSPMGTEHPHMAPSGIFQAEDGGLALATVTEKQWRDLCAGIDRIELIFDPRFAVNAARVQHRDELNAELGAVLRTKPVFWWVEALQGRKVPAAPLLTPVQIVEDPHVLATEMLTTVETHWGPVTVAGTPARFSVTPTHLRAGPSRGEHTDQVFGELDESMTL